MHTLWTKDAYFLSFIYRDGLTFSHAEIRSPIFHDRPSWFYSGSFDYRTNNVCYNGQHYPIS